MASRVVVTPEQEPNRIEGFCTIPPWPNAQSVIGFTRSGNQWHISSSIGLPANLDQALAIMECFNLAFKELEKIQSKID